MTMIIRPLTPGDRKRLLSFAYERERENLFLIGSLVSELTFRDNSIFGAFSGRTLIGVGTFFRVHRNLVVHGRDRTVISELIDALLPELRTLETIADFGKYARTAIDCLRTRGIEPREIRKETVCILTLKSFVNFHEKATPSTERDRDDIVRFNRAMDGKRTQGRISEKERRIVAPPGGDFIIRVGGRIVAKAGIHGYSDHFVQVGGVATLPAERGKGHAKDAVSAVCNYWLRQGKEVLLFRADDNGAAKHIYDEIGFVAQEEFLIGLYA